MSKLVLAFLLIFSFFLVSCAATHSFDEVKRNYHSHHYSQAFSRLYLIGKRGTPQEQYALGYLYYYGLGTAKDPDTGRYWIRKAAERHYAPAKEALEMITEGRAAYKKDDKKR